MLRWIMLPAAPPIVPELDVADLDRSLRFYVDVLGFSSLIERPEDRFAYLTRGPVHLMLEEADGPGRRFSSAPLEYPFGRGINLQIEVPDVDSLNTQAIAAGARILRGRCRRVAQGEHETVGPFEEGRPLDDVGDR